VLQGLAAGGEWGGAVLMTAEHARTSRRGFFASFPMAGAPAGMVVSSGVIALVSNLTTDAQFLSWGWRIPFLLSVVLLFIGLWIRLSVMETPAFAALKATRQETRVPVVDLLVTQWRTLALAILAAVGAFVVQGVVTVYILSYGMGAGFSRSQLLNATTFSSACAVVGIIVLCALTDRVGRRPVLIAGAILSGAWSFAFFPLVDTGELVWLLVALVVAQAVFHAAYGGVLAPLMSELFSTRSRYTGASLAYQIAAIGAGVTPGLFATLLKNGAGTGTLSLIVAGSCLLSLVCLLALGETRHRDLAADVPGGSRTSAPADLPRS